MVKKAIEESNFDSVLLEAIDETLSVYGERFKSALLTYLDTTVGMRKSDIPARIDEFARALQNLFGLGSRSLEILIMKNLHSRVGVVWEWKASNPWALPDLSFKDYVIFAKKYFEDDKEYEEKMIPILPERKARKMYR